MSQQSRPLMWVGAVIMIIAALVGFKPSLVSLMLLFVTTLLGGAYIKNQYPELYDGFVRLFGYGVIVINLVFVAMVMFTPLDYIDKASSAFLNLMVVMVIATLLKLKRKQT